MRLLIAPPEEKKRGVAIFVIPPSTPSNHGSFVNAFSCSGLRKAPELKMAELPPKPIITP